MDESTMKSILAKTHADLSNNVRDYKKKLERIECRQVLQATAALEYHYTCIRDNLHQIEYHLQEIENQSKQLDLEPVTSAPKLAGNEHKSVVQKRAYFTRGMSGLLTPSFIQTFDEFHEVSDSLQRPPNGEVLSSNFGNNPPKKWPAYNKSQSNERPTSWNETML